MLAERQRTAFVAMWDEIIGRNPFYTQKFAGCHFDPRRDDISQLPLTTRKELHADQTANPPYGTNLTYPLVRYCRYHQTSGTSGTPLRWLDTAESWSWFVSCWKAIFAAADVTADDRVVFPFSFGPFIGFWAAFEAATQLGNLALPAGGMTTAARLAYIIDNAVTVVCCTPTYALRMGEQAADSGVDLVGSPVRALIVAGEPGGNVLAVRARIEALWGARVYDHVGMTEVGAWGFETTGDPGVVQILETEFIAEVIDPESGDAVAEGEPGELVLTNLGRWACPLIRYRTGDRVVVSRDASISPFARLVGGVQGRVDDMLFIRGNNVFPSAIEEIIRRIDDVVEYRVRVGRAREMDDLLLEVEPRDGADGSAVVEQVSAALRDQLHFAARVVAVAGGTLPRFEMKARRVVRE
ncbi:MAG: AMP-binding protein [Phycisphaerales bacterium]|nr:AMP-binding protein [Phycisphaerales bacterium]